MKFSTTLALAVAPLAMARRVQNAYPAKVARGAESELDERSYEVVNGMGGYGITANSMTEIIIIWGNPGGHAATTTYNHKMSATEAAAPPATHTVTVGGPAGLIYQPDTLSVPVGDMVIFEFLSQNHTVSQSAFNTPCKKLEHGMDSGFQPNPNNTISPPPQVAMQVQSAGPLWFYCRQKGHCGKGMVFSINPTAQKTQAQFQQMAIAQNGTGAASPITGGQPAAAAPPASAPPASAPPASAPPAYAPPASAPPAYTPPASAPAAAAPPASPAPAASGNGVMPGSGSVGADGSCSCFVQCSAGSFPVNAQGSGAHGGWAGSLPMNVAAMK